MFHQSATTLPNRGRNLTGTYVKFTACAAVQTFQFMTSAPQKIILMCLSAPFGSRCCKKCSPASVVTRNGGVMMKRSSARRDARPDGLLLGMPLHIFSSVPYHQWKNGPLTTSPKRKKAPTLRAREGFWLGARTRRDPPMISPTAAMTPADTAFVWTGFSTRRRRYSSHAAASMPSSCLVRSDEGDGGAVGGVCAAVSVASVELPLDAMVVRSVCDLPPRSVAAHAVEVTPKRK
mmetsp:Transcript_73685/g.209982  ORF Transcript_73685/g.209982 Transcript_73685/m.209982 type:complete len:234 (-) Transcript_73685:72-773(-)